MTMSAVKTKKVGTILHGSWGSRNDPQRPFPVMFAKEFSGDAMPDWMNPEFFQVVERPSPHFAVVRKIGKTRPWSFMPDMVAPVPGDWLGEPMRKLIKVSYFMGEPTFYITFKETKTKKGK